MSDPVKEALRALVEALPKCDCGAVATYGGWEVGDYSCDEHPSGPSELGYAAALHAAVAVLHDGSAR